MDNLKPEDRRKNMQNIRSKNTSIERIMFKLLKDNKLRFKKHYNIHGKPDIAFPHYKIAVFLDSDYWHGWHFKKWRKKLPKVYWRGKIEGNIRRDKYNHQRLRKQGWKVLRLWEHQIKRDPNICLEKIVRTVKK